MRLIDTTVMARGSYVPNIRYFANRNPALLAKPVVGHLMSVYKMLQEYKCVARWETNVPFLRGTDRERWGFDDHESH